jgi:superfamily II DNA or RNA helicase
VHSEFKPIRSGLKMDSDSSPPPSPPPSILQRYGGFLSKRFMSAKSSLHAQQKEALQRLGDWFSESNEVKGEKTKDYTAVVSMPTGTGKTGVMCCLPYYLGGADLHSIDFSKPILIIAPGLTILDQLEENLMGDPFLKRPCIGLIKPGDRRYGYTVHRVRNTADIAALEHAGTYDIVLTNAQKWRRKSDSDQTPNYEDLPGDFFSIIIVDEAHHLPAKQWQEILSKFTKNAKLIFFTATPYRADHKEITKDLALSKVGFAYKLTREEAIEAKLIREVKWEILKDSAPVEDPAPANKRQKLERSKTEDGRLEHGATVLREIKQCLEKKNQHFPLPGGKKHAAIVVAYNIDEAKEVKRMCKRMGLKSESVHSEKKKHSNKNIIENIKSGEYEVVVIVKMLLEGFDHPPFSIAGIVTRIVSPVKFEQFIGRVQRVVREKNEAGEDEIEANVKADVITHTYFDQEDLIKKYDDPVIPDNEDQSLDFEYE